MNLKMEIKGVSDMTRKLEGRIRRLQQSILRKALQAFAEPIRAEAERIMKQEISPKMKVITKIRLRGDSGSVYIGPPTEAFRIVGGSGKTAGGTITHAMIAYFREFGYDILSPPYRSTKGGPVYKHIGSGLDMTRAFNSKKDAGLAAMEQVLRDALEQDVAA